jgi:hypothetical protein
VFFDDFVCVLERVDDELLIVVNGMVVVASLLATSVAGTVVFICTLVARIGQ